MKNQLTETKCKRCGKQLVKTTRSFYGANEAKVKFGDICAHCITQSEQNEMLHEQAKAIRGIS